MESKCCPRCREVLPLDAFGVGRQKKDGLKVYCKPCHNACNKESRERNPETSNLSTRNWERANPERVRERKRLWAEKNPGRMTELATAWRKRNPERELANTLKRRLRPEWRLKRTLSSRIRGMLNGKAGRRTVDLVGYSTSELRAHLEKQFVNGMNWDNYGKWHIDHIVPVASFTIKDFDDPELKRAWSLSNLRPLWASENRQKHDKVLYLI